MNLSRLPAPPPSIVGSSDFESRRHRSLDPDKIIFRPDCIFCEKEWRKKVQVNTSYSSEQMLVMLFLCNALDSHPTIIFKSNGSFCRPNTLHFNFLTEKAHREAFDIVKSFIERFLILGKSVVKLKELREIYVSKLAETEFSNPNY
jgi:hypothetical protein